LNGRSRIRSIQYKCDVCVVVVVVVVVVSRDLDDDEKRQLNAKSKEKTTMCQGDDNESIR